MWGSWAGTGRIVGVGETRVVGLKEVRGVWSFGVGREMERGGLRGFDLGLVGKVFVVGWE